MSFCASGEQSTEQMWIEERDGSGNVISGFPSEMNYPLELVESVFRSNLESAGVHGFEQVEYVPVAAALSQVRNID